MMWNNYSGGVCSTAMALIYPKIPNVIVNTGGNYPWAWRNVHKLRQERHKVIVLSSFVQGYPTYFEYIRKNELMPFYMTCCSKAKDMHLDYFYNTIPGKQVVNIGFIKGEERRAERLAEKNTRHRIFNFPMLDYERDTLVKFIEDRGYIAKKTGCWFCPKQENPPEWVLTKFKKLYSGPLPEEQGIEVLDHE